MALSPTDIKAILDALEASDWDTATVTADGVTISVARNGATLIASGSASAPAAAAVAPPVAAATPAPAVDSPLGHVLAAPSVGVFWRSPRPGAPPFVEVGQRVAVGETVCIVEMMKLMNNVVADVAGTVVAIHVGNADPVEYGTPLITIAPA